MRLTLRTLLAYLDNTLQPNDAELLRQKLSESGFATTLVRRIRSSLARPDLSAPSPDAIGPVEDANLTSEYLDSTLPPEQIAEIERAALESDSQLAETAACHQILTMVLGRPAHVSSDLRDRIYQLPERDLREINDRLDPEAPATSFSSLSIEPAAPAGSLGDEALMGGSLADESIGSEVDSDNVLTARADRVIEPVGKTDSGVTDAPDRLRESAAAEGPAMAGVGSNRIDEAMLSSGSSRMRQVVPLLVSLAVCAVLLFALSRVFQPLLSKNDDVALADDNEPLPPLPQDQPSSDGLSSDPSPGNVEVIPPPPGAMVEVDLEDVADLPMPSSPTPPSPIPAPEPQPVSSDVAASSNGDGELEIPAPIPAPVGASVTGDPLGSPLNSEASDSATMPEPNGSPEVDSLAPPVPQPSDPVVAMGPGTNEAAASPDATIAAMPTPPAVAEADLLAPPEGVPAEPSPDDAMAGKLVGQPTLLVRLVDRQWQRIDQGEAIASDQFLVTAPSFQTTIAVDDRFQLTLVGPAAGRLIREDDLTVVHIDFGRAIIQAKADGVEIPLSLADQLIGLNLESAETTAAISVSLRRPPGADLMDPATRTTQVSLLAAQGQMDWAGAGAPQSLSTGQGWTRIDQGDYQPLQLEQMPPWVSPLDPKDDKSLEATARKGLLALLVDNQPIEQSLREATMFRRAEVVDLAAETMLAIGQAEPYFGGDGILNDPKQRIYWSKHFEALVTTINRNPIFARAVLSDAQRMDSANAEAIARLLTGYSQSDLETGGDRELVEMLQSPSMTIRALAIANLKAITGTTLLYRADYDTEARRNAGVKKWSARLRKGDIRWPEKREPEEKRPGKDSAASDEVAPPLPETLIPAPNGTRDEPSEAKPVEGDSIGENEGP